MLNATTSLTKLFGNDTTGVQNIMFSVQSIMTLATSFLTATPNLFNTLIKALHIYIHFY